MAEQIEAGERIRRVPFPKVEHRTPPEFLPLSISQKLWIESGIVPHQDQWLPIVWRLDGRFDLQIFVKAYGRLLHRHNILRTRILSRNEGLVQQVETGADVRLAVVDMQQVPADMQELEVHRQIRAVLDQRPSLESGPVHLRLFRLRADLHVLGGFIHNSAMDMASHRMFFHELMDGYVREVEGRPVLPPGNLQHSDYALWESQWLTPQQVAEADQSWKRRLAGAEALRLPKGRMYGDPATSWATERLLMPAEMHAETVRQAAARKVSLSAHFYAALAIALAKWSGQNSILFGTILSGRPSGFRSVMGSFMQIRPFFADLRSNPTLGDFVAEAGRSLVAAHDIRMPISPATLQHLSAGNVLVNFARTRQQATPPNGEAQAAKAPATPKARVTDPSIPTWRPNMQGSRPGLRVSRRERATAMPASMPTASNNRQEGQRLDTLQAGKTQAPVSALRTSAMALPKPLAPEFSRDLYFNMHQSPGGVHGLVTYSDTRHSKERVKQLIDQVFSIMAVMNTSPDQKVSSVR
jgi:hypothetical protein